MPIPLNDTQLDAFVADQSWWFITTRSIIDERRRMGKPVYLHSLFHVLLHSPKAAEALLATADGDAEDVENLNAMLEQALPENPRSHTRGAEYIAAWVSRQSIRHTIKNARAVVRIN